MDFTMPENVKGWIKEAERDNGLGVKAVEMNPIQYADLRKSGRDELEIVTDSSLWKSGLQAMMGGVEIRVSKKVRLDTVVMRFDNDTQAVYGMCLEKKDKACRHQECWTVREVLES